MAIYTAPEVVLIIGALGAICVQMITAWRQTIKLNDTFTKVAVIEGHVNGEKTRSIEQISSLQRENTVLRSIINDKTQTAAVLAQAISTNKKVDTYDSLKNIEKNTKDIASNTASDK